MYPKTPTGSCKHLLIGPCMFSLTKVLYFKCTSNILEVYFQSIFEVYFKYT